MTYIATISDEAAEGTTAELYDAIREDMGHVPNFVRAFGHRPEILLAWEDLLTKIKATMDYRRYEIATIAAARELRSSYCMLAHGTAFMEDGLSAEALEALARTGGGQDFDETEEAIFAYAAKVTRDASSVTQDDIDVLRSHGLSDPEIFDIATVAAVRCFISKVSDAVGAEPDAHYNGMEAGLREALVVGRGIESE